MQVIDTTPSLIVGIGGSAGALPALIALLEALGGDVPLALVVVLHLSPDHESSAAEVLQRSTPLSVMQVKVRTKLQAGHVYVIAPGTNLVTEDGHVQPAAIGVKRPSTVIDQFFRSLAEVHRERAVAVVLSGTGHDGASGLTQVNELGGLTIAQSPEDCEHDDMPLAAIATGIVDLELTADAIGKRLIELAKYPRLTALAAEAMSDAEPAAPPVAPAAAAIDDDSSPERAVQDVLAALRIRMRHDFRHYKRATVMRRLERRVQMNRLASLQEYRDYVRDHPEELQPLLADMLISVTNFFRDPAAFEVLQREVVPLLMRARAPGDEVRVWVPACASGEESYSVAILLQEYANTLQHPPRLQIFASDINDAALAVGRAAVYPLSIAADIAEPRLLAFFEKDARGRYRVRPAVRETVVFAHHNVLGDPPFSRLDLICCRNLLIYLDRTAQEVVLELFAFALKPGGYLFLGNAESPDLLGSSFEPVSKAHRIYRLRPEAAATLRRRMRVPRQLVAASAAAVETVVGQGRSFEPAQAHATSAALHQLALVAAAPPNVLISADYELERVSPGAGRFVAFGEGVPTRSLLANVAADIRTELRAALYRADESRKSVKVVFRRDSEAAVPGAVMTLTIHPVQGADGERLNWLVLFEESDAGGDLGPQTVHEGNSARESAMGRLEEENRTLKSDLQDTLDRSAINTEELKASNEELQAINEELRSAKEELEASKEELQSLNEELTTVNFELRMKVDESSRSNDDLRNLMEVAEIATVFVDAGMRVTRFTPQATKLFPLIPTDVGRPLTDVSGRLHYDEMLDDAMTAFKQLRPVERSISGFDGQHFLARVMPYRTSQDKIGGVVLTFTDVTKLREAETAVILAEERIRDAIAASRDFAVLTIDTHSNITTWNEGATAIFGHAAEAVVGQPFEVIFMPEDRAAGAPQTELRNARLNGRAADERWHQRSDGGTVYCSGVVTPLRGRGDGGFIKICNDQTKSKTTELRQGLALTDQRREAASAIAGNSVRDRFLAVMSHELKQPLNLIQVNAQLLTRLPEFAQSQAAQRIGSTIMRAVGAQETIVNDLLDLSRVQTGKMHLNTVTTDLTEIVQMLSQAIGADASHKGIALSVEAMPAVMCHADPVRLEQVVWNLLGNAVKFTPQNGHIVVKVAVDGEFARLEIADDGVGISAKYLPQIFELFGQAPPAESGSAAHAGLGIGLALVRDLVNAHGGRIEAASPGTDLGSTFTVWLPSAATSTPAAEPTTSLSSMADQRVLLVDDEPDSLEAFAMLLQLQGAKVDTTTSASTALDMLSTGGYDLLLSDIGMANMSGIELIKQARQLTLAKPLVGVAITGYGSESDVRDALEAGFDAHISKPVSLERLQATLQRL